MKPSDFFNSTFVFCIALLLVVLILVPLPALGATNALQTTQNNFTIINQFAENNKIKNIKNSLLSHNIFDESDSNKVDENELETKIPDTLFFKYKFVPGDSIFYSVFSTDSIIVNYDDPLLRLRRERILITCDSINDKGNFCLTQKLVSFRGIESYKDEKDIERTTSEWINVPIYIELDSLGRRIKVLNSDTSSAISTPGGVFQPVLLMPLILTNINKKAENESWLNSTTDYLAENAMPMPMFKNTTLMRLNGKYDTLGFSTLKFTFSRSGQASYELITPQYSIKTTGVINSGGELLLDTTYWVPIYISHTLDQKLNFYYPDNKEQPGWHFLRATFILEHIKRPEQQIIRTDKRKRK